MSRSIGFVEFEEIYEKAYGWEMSDGGELHGLVSGDMGYDDTGVTLMSLYGRAQDAADHATSSRLKRALTTLVDLCVATVRDAQKPPPWENPGVEGAPPGFEITYLGRNGYDFEREAADKRFTVGDVLRTPEGTTKMVRRTSWGSVVIDGHGAFNSVMFAPATEAPAVKLAYQRHREKGGDRPWHSLYDAEYRSLVAEAKRDLIAEGKMVDRSADMIRRRMEANAKWVSENYEISGR